MNTKFTAVPTWDQQRVRTNSRLRRPAPNRDQQCGIGSCTPSWLQNFADPKVYLIVFCFLGVIQGAYFTYFIGVISTLEKRFAFESKISGVIMIADNLSPIFTSTLVGYFGGKTHRPRLIAGGMLLVVLSCFLSAVPYFMYGPALHLLAESDSVFKKRDTEFCDGELKERDCSDNVVQSTIPAVSILFVANFMNGFGYTAFYTIGAPYLDDNVKKKNSPVYFSAMAALRIFGPALGFLLSSFCLKYYEDPFYDPGISALNPRWVGAWWIGFIVIGIALLIFTALLALFPRELPDRFRSEDVKRKDSEEKPEPPSFRDYPKAIKKLMKNPILVCHVISVTFQINGFAGYFVFMPKFMESQYHQSASSASLFSGATGIIAMLLGILLGGLLIKKYKPRPRYLTGYMVLVEIFSVIGLLVSIFLGCPPISMPGTSYESDETMNLINECNKGCGCTRRIFEPVCSADGASTFFSPCFAGCQNNTIPMNMTQMNSTMNVMETVSLMNQTDMLATTMSVLPTINWTETFTSDVFSSFNSTDVLNPTLYSPLYFADRLIQNSSLLNLTTALSKPIKEKIYQNCDCLLGVNSTFTSSYATSGFCSLNCNMFVAYIIMLSISKFVSSTARVGNTLITFRCVDAKDKSFALGTFGSVLAAFAFIPYPLIFGALTDSACLVWEHSCSKTGNCWLYDSEKFRFYLHGMAMLLISIGICFDGVVFLLSDRLTNFYGEDEEKEKEMERITRWIKEEEEEDVIFTKVSRKQHPISDIDTVL